MNKRLDDRLLELAFDSRSPELPTDLRHDNEANDRLEEYAKLKTALNAMRDIPEHQLSTERLRAALLQQDLKRRFAFPWQSLGYATTACVLFVGAFVAGHTLRQPHPNTEVVMNPAKAPQVFGSSVPVIHAGSVIKQSKEVKALAANITSAKKLDPTRHSHVNLVSNEEFESTKSIVTTAMDTHGSDSRLANPMFTQAMNIPTGSTVAASRSAGTTAAGNGNLAQASKTNVNGKTAPKEKVVVLQGDTDSTSGLDTAQEVTANHDVLYGG